MRLLLVFEMKPRLRHLGHLDLMRTMQRALRRSGLPIAYSQGYNPHVLLNFASALSVGINGEQEIMDVPVTVDTDPAEAVQRMNTVLPAGLRVLRAVAVEDRHPSVSSLMEAAVFRFSWQRAEDAETVAGSLPAFLMQESILADRKSKSGIIRCDILPLMQQVHMDGDCLVATLIQSGQNQCKPAMLLSALASFTGKENLPVRVTRVQLLGRNADQQLVPLETV